MVLELTWYLFGFAIHVFFLSKTTETTAKDGINTKAPITSFLKSRQILRWVLCIRAFGETNAIPNRHLDILKKNEIKVHFTKINCNAKPKLPKIILQPQLMSIFV